MIDSILLTCPRTPRLRRQQNGSTPLKPAHLAWSEPATNGNYRVFLLDTDAGQELATLGPESQPILPVSTHFDTCRLRGDKWIPQCWNFESSQPGQREFAVAASRSGSQNTTLRFCVRIWCYDERFSLLRVYPTRTWARRHHLKLETGLSCEGRTGVGTGTDRRLG
jgi:hypothetical protein